MSNDKVAATFHPETPDEAAARLREKTTMNTDGAPRLTHLDHPEEDRRDDHR